MKVGNINKLFFFLGLLLAAGCKDSNEPTVSGCLIKSALYTDNDFSRELTYFYDNNGRLIQTKATTSTGFSGEGVITYDDNETR
jgi:hypothetical protein